MIESLRRRAVPAGLALAALLAAGVPSRAAPAADDAAVVAAPPGAAEGEADRVLDALVGVVERDRSGPLSQAALLATRGWWDRAKDPAPLVARLEAVATRGIPQGDSDEALRRTLGDRYLEAGRLEDRARVGLDAGYLGEFLVVGPFGVAANASVDAVHPPEEGIDLEKEMEGKRGRVRWIPYRDLGIGNLIEPFEYLRPTNGVAYALAQVRSASGGPAVLKFTCWSPHKVFLNGVEVLRVPRLRREAPRTAWVPVTLGAGWNRILVKVVGTSGFALKLCDPGSGLPLAGIEAEEGTVLHPAVPPQAPPERVAYRSNLDALGAAEPSTGPDFVVRARIRESYDDPWGAYEDYEEAARRSPGDPGILLRLAAFVQDFREMPEPRWRKNRARTLYEDVLEKFPLHAEAVVALARILHGEDKTEEALAGLKELTAAGEAPEDPAAAKAAAETRAAMERSRRVFPGLDAMLEARPGDAHAWFVRSQFAADRRWWKEAEDAAAKSAEANPRYLPALSYLLRTADNFGNAERAEELCRRIVAVDRGAYRVRRQLSEILRKRGDFDGALEILRAVEEENPSDFSVREARAALLESLRRYDDALAVYRALEAISLLEDRYPRKVGELLRYKGDDEGAKAAWSRALALDPGIANLRRELERLEGGDYDFARRWDVDAEAMWKEAGGQEEHAKAVAIHLVDLMVVRVNEDGSWTSITHDAYKVLNEKGREKYSDIRVPGQLLEVRAVSPEGEVFLPIGARGNAFTLEGLQAGWLVEYRYLRDQGRDERGFDSGLWYFQDPNFGADADPVVLSRLVVDMPESMDPNYLLRNYEGRPEVTVEDGRRIFVFEKRDMPRVEDEPRMPGPEEICPWVHFHTEWTWDEVNLELQDPLRRFQPSPVLARKARDVAGTAEGSLAKARAIYDFVNEEIKGDAGGWGPTGTLLEKSGNRFLLFGAMLSSLEVPFDLVRVATGDEEDARWEIVQPGLFNEMGLLVRGPDDASLEDDAFVFPFSRHTPFGRVPERDLGKPAMVPGPRGPVLFRMPEGTAADREAVHRVSIDLGATAEETTFRISVLNPNDGWFGFKERLKDMNDDDRKKTTVSLVGNLVKTPNLREYTYPRLEEKGAPFALEAKGELPLQLTTEGGRTVVPLGPPPLDVTGRYVERPERDWPLVLRGTDLRRDEVAYDLGGKWRVKSLPRGHAAASKIGTYSLTVWQEGGKVKVERRVDFRECRYTPDEYRDFVAWCKDIDTAEEQRIELERSE